MNARLKRKSTRLHLPAPWKKIFSAASVLVFSIIISTLFLSLIPCPTDLPDGARLHRSAQVSSSTGIILNNQHTNTSRELKSCDTLIDSLKSEGWREIYHSEDLFQSLDPDSHRAGIEKNATPGFVCRWLLHYHRNHKKDCREN